MEFHSKIGQKFKKSCFLALEWTDERISVCQLPLACLFKRTKNIKTQSPLSKDKKVVPFLENRVPHQDWRIQVKNNENSANMARLIIEAFKEAYKEYDRGKVTRSMVNGYVTSYKGKEIPMTWHSQVSESVTGSVTEPVSETVSKSSSQWVRDRVTYKHATQRS